MTTYLALLRGVNVAGHQQVAMADLREMLAQLGCADAQSLLQSGNLVFRSRPRSPSQLEGLLEKETEKRLGLRADFLVRTSDEWKRAVDANPFPEEAQRDPAHLLLFLLKEPPRAANIRALQAAITGREIVGAIGREAFIVYPDGVGRSRLTHKLIEDKLGTRATGRNWNTVMKLQAMAGAR